MNDLPPYDVAAAELRPLGVKITVGQGEYVLTYRGMRNSPEQHADDLAEAIASGREMAAHPPLAAIAPMGPTGRRHTRRGRMLKHNRWIAARRRAAAARAAKKGDTP